MNNRFAADPNSAPGHPMLAEEDVRKEALRRLRLGLGTLAISLIGVILWISLIGIVKDPVENLATQILGPAIERFVGPFLVFLSLGVMILPTLAFWWARPHHTQGCPACGANHPSQYAEILLYRICPICHEEILDRRSESEEEYHARQKKWWNAEASIHFAWFVLILPTMVAVSWLVDSSYIEASPHRMMWTAMISVIIITGCWLLSRNRRIAITFGISLAFLAVGIWSFLRL